MMLSGPEMGTMNHLNLPTTPGGLSEEEKYAERKRDIVVLVMRFLLDYGYVNSYHSLSAESNVSLGQIDAADNIDLMTIVQEFVDYYHSKFGRYPKMVRQTYGDYGQDLHHQAGSGSPSGHRNTSMVMPGTLPSSSMHVSTGGAGANPIGTSTRLGTNEPITQEDFVAALNQGPHSVPSQYFSFKKPSKSNSRKRSNHLSMEEMQEDIMYALVGCLNVGWSIKNISADTRDFLQTRYGIDKDMIQLFFKNRAQKMKRNRSDRKTSGPMKLEGML